MTAPTETTDREPVSSEPDPDLEPDPDSEPQRRRFRLGRDRLRGGRWTVWVTRLLVWTVLGLAALGALRLLIEPPLDQVVDQAVSARLAGDGDVPTDEAAALAERLAVDYFTHHPDQADGSDRWDQHLAEDARIDGWDGDQPVTVDHVSAVAVDNRGDGQLIATVAALLEIGDEPAEWRHLAVPIAADRADRLTVAGSPTLTAPPTRAAVDPRERPDTDTQLTNQLAGDIEEFFSAYGRGAQPAVDAFTATDTDLAALPEQAQLVEVTQLAVHDGDGAQRTAAATVEWRLTDEDTDAPVTVTQRYDLAVVRDDGRWLVTDLAPQTDVAPTEGR